MARVVVSLEDLDLEGGGEWWGDDGMRLDLSVRRSVSSLVSLRKHCLAFSACLPE